MKRLLWAVWCVGVAFVLVILSCLPMAFLARIGLRIRANANVQPLRTDGTTTLAVFGDTQKGLAAFAELAKRAKAEGIDLAVHTGDLVSHADEGHYDLAEKWVREAHDFYVPFVVTPGNHDIKGGEGLFEERIGPRQFAFRWGPVDIVVIDNAVAPPGEASVERLLAAARGPILLFMHVPLNDTTLKTLVAKSTYNCFLEMIRKYPVRYVFSGHAHGYSRIEDGGIVFISNGVGGDSDSWQFDQKAYLTIVEADSKSIKDRSIVIEPVIGVRANIEHLAIGHVGEIVLHRNWGIPALLLSIVLLVLVFRRLRKKKREDPTPDSPKKFKFTPAKTSEPPDIVI